MSDAEITAAALSGPDAQPLSDETARPRRRLTQEEFAARYHIPVGTLRDWEQGRTEPDQTARAYLRAIAGNPRAVREALEVQPG